MNLDDFIITCFCLIDELMPVVTKGQRLRERRPAPKLSDSEVITIEVVGCYLGLSQDQEIFTYFHRHYTSFFPGLSRLHRTTFVRQATNLWAIKERLWCLIRDELLPYDPSGAIVDSMPVLVCALLVPIAVGALMPGPVTTKIIRNDRPFTDFACMRGSACLVSLRRCMRALANVQEGEVVLDLTEGTRGQLLGDRNYWLPRLKETLSRLDICLLAPDLRAKHQPKGSWSPVLGRIRYHIDTVFGQLTDRCGLKRMWARDLWHLRNRLLRMVLMHTLSILFNLEHELPPLQLATLVA